MAPNRDGGAGVYKPSDFHERGMLVVTDLGEHSSRHVRIAIMPRPLIDDQDILGVRVRERLKQYTLD
jgi:hypothetical protein